MEVTFVDLGGGRKMPVYHNLDYNVFVNACIKNNIQVEHSTGHVQSLAYVGPYVMAPLSSIQALADKIKPTKLAWKQINSTTYILIPGASSGSSVERWR